MKTLLLLLPVLVFAGRSPAKEKVKFDDLLLSDGTTLKEAVVLKVEPDGLRLEHKEGVSKVKFEDLPEEVQKQFTFDREQADKFRQEKDTARELRLTAERKARVEEIVAQKRSEQESDLQKAREAFFAVLESDEYSYPQMDRALLESINVFKEAGRKDLGAQMEDDRKLLRERELVRPGPKFRQEKDQLQTRIQQLEKQIAALGQPPAVQVVRDTELVPWFVDRPVIIDRPIVVDRPVVQPTVPCPPVTRPVTSPQPSRPSLSPQFTPAVPHAPQPVRPSPSGPVMPVTLPSGGAQQQGAHLWKKP